MIVTESYNCRRRRFPYKSQKPFIQTQFGLPRAFGIGTEPRNAA